jgi:hypothetical protein
MTPFKHVRLVIHSDASCALDALNFADATCTQATQEIMRILGGQAVSERFKPEAQRLPPQSVRQEVGR